MQITITPIDPIVCRDGRPFGLGAGIRMRSMDWISCSVAAGSLRTMVGKMRGRFDPEELKKISIRGPLPAVECGSSSELYFPAPRDLSVDSDNNIYKVMPDDSSGCGSNIPGNLRLPCLQGLSEDDFKPVNTPAFWSYSNMCCWLKKTEHEKGKVDFKQNGFMENLQKDERTHIAMGALGVAEDKHIFTTTALDFKYPATKEKAVQIHAVMDADDRYKDELSRIDSLHTIGGERRLAWWKTSETSKGWECEDSLKDAVASTRQLRMVLATPAIFGCGWRPGWLDNDMCGEIPGTGCKVQLVSAAIGRVCAHIGLGLCWRGPKGSSAHGSGGERVFF